MGYPKFGTAPIKCAKRGCKFRGYETDLKKHHLQLKKLQEQCRCALCVDTIATSF